MIVLSSALKHKTSFNIHDKYRVFTIFLYYYAINLFYLNQDFLLNNKKFFV